MQEKVTIDRQSSKAEDGSKAPPANQEQADCRSAIVAHTDIQAGPPAAPVSSAPKGAYETILKGNLTLSQIAGRVIPIDQQQDR